MKVPPGALRATVIFAFSGLGCPAAAAGAEALAAGLAAVLDGLAGARLAGAAAPPQPASSAASARNENLFTSFSSGRICRFAAGDAAEHDDPRQAVQRKSAG